MILNQDLIIKGGYVVDGSGKIPFKADLKIENGLISDIGKQRFNTDQRIIDATNLFVAPGFIDTHSHSDLMFLSSKNKNKECKIRQGVTTEIIGQDGIGVAPVNKMSISKVKDLVKGLIGDSDIPKDWRWNDISSYVKTVSEYKIPNNFAILIPHGTVRVAVKGMNSGLATDQELKNMKDIVRKGMEQGAVGLSTGLYYTPCNFADRNELIQLTQVVGEYNGGLVVHMRNESDLLLSSIEEVCDVCIKAGTWLHISHFKIVGKNNWGKSKDALNLINSFRQQGLSITMDQYPYTAGTTGLIFRLPPWLLKDGINQALKYLSDTQVRKQIKEELEINSNTWENRVLIVGWDNHIISYLRQPQNKKYIGKSISEISESEGMHPVDLVCDLLIEEKGAISVITFFSNEKDLIRIMSDTHTMVGTDGIPSENPHPRLYGSFPRILGKYVREMKVIDVAEAVRKMTSLPAKTFNLSKRGQIKKGWIADIVIFNPDIVIDRATYKKPIQNPLGIEWVLIGGQVVISPKQCNANIGAGQYVGRA